MRPVASRAPRLRPARVRATLLGLAGVAALVAVWEGYKALAPETGVSVGDTLVLPRTSDLAMPHVWEMWSRALEPVTGAPGAPPLWQAVLGACGFTLRTAATGWVAGVVVGLALGMLMQRLRTARDAILPWVVLSQTVPLIALAPLVKRWGSQLHLGSAPWPDWLSVAVIAAYLAFFPVAVGALRGFSSPETVHVELMRTYGVGWWQTFRRLRLPASVPFLLPALRLAAAGAVVGTVVGEVSIGLRGGIGRMIVEFGATGSSDPAKQWSPIAGAVLVGLVAAGAVAALALPLSRYRSSEVRP